MALRTIDEVPAPELAAELGRGARLVVYDYTISLFVMTFKRESSVFLVPPGEGSVGAGFTYTIVSLLFGWWGIPWGPIHTIMSLVTNLGGGRDVTAPVRAKLALSTPAERWVAALRAPTPAALPVAGAGGQSQAPAVVAPWGQGGGAARVTPWGQGGGSASTPSWARGAGVVPSAEQGEGAIVPVWGQRGEGYARGARVLVRGPFGQQSAGAVLRMAPERCLVAFDDGREAWIETRALAPG